MLSLVKKARNPIASVKINGLTQFIDLSDENSNKLSDIIKKYSLKNDELEILKKAIKYDKEPKDKYLKEIYKELIDRPLKLEKEIKLENCEISPYPVTAENQRSCLFISGPAGSGKSTMVSKFITNYIKEFPKNNIIIFSNVLEDEAYDKFDGRVKRIKIHADLIADPIDIKTELADSLCIFDDIESIRNKQMKDCIIDIRDECLECGRHYNISCAVISHILMNGKKMTGLPINESNRVIVFPKSGSTYHIRSFCRQYAGMDSKSTQKLLNLNSRWVCIKKDYPITIIHEGGAYIM